MRQYYLIQRPSDTTDWFPVTETNGAPTKMDMVTAILCASIVTKTREVRTDGLVIDEAVIAEVETGEQVGKFERGPQLDLLQEPRHAAR